MAALIAAGGAASASPINPAVAPANNGKRADAADSASARRRGAEPPAPVLQASSLNRKMFLPLVAAGPSGCQPIGGEVYGTASVNPPPTDRPPEVHADLNLALRGSAPTSAFLGLVDYGGASDPGAPQLPGLFANNRTPAFTQVLQVFGWSWECNCRTTPISSPWVTMVGMGTALGETIHVPSSGYEIGSGYEVLVLYASPARITLKYTRDDNVVYGYTLHVNNVCVEPALLNLYQSWNVAGRSQLPALRSGQALGRAGGSSIDVSIRDSGMFLDPRSRKDWWQGR